MRRRILEDTSRGAKARFVSVALFIVIAGSLTAQIKPALGAREATDSAEPGQRDFRFEVASIRPVGPPTGSEYPSGVIPPSYTPGRYKELKVSLGILAWKAFGVKHGYQIECPEWMYSSYFTVNATLPDGAGKTDLPIMIQHLLEDRFGLAFHHETRKVAGYVLIVAKSGPKLTSSAGAPPDGITARGPSFEFKNGVPQFSKDAASTQLYTRGAAIWHGRDRTVQKLAEDIADQLATPVTDATGILGKYDYTLTFTTETRPVSQGMGLSPIPPTGGSGPTTNDAAPPEDPLLRDALREQLGLQLQPLKNVPVDVVVLDSAKKQPTEN